MKTPTHERCPRCGGRHELGWLPVCATHRDCLDPYIPAAVPTIAVAVPGDLAWRCPCGRTVPAGVVAWLLPDGRTRCADCVHLPKERDL